MARVTVEDCVLKIPNRFELVLVSAQRAREISSGAALKVERDNDKNPVVALREIADTSISLEGLRDALVRNHQKVIEIEDTQEEVLDVMEGEESEWAQYETEAANSELAGAGLHEGTGDEPQEEADTPTAQEDELPGGA